MMWRRHDEPAEMMTTSAAAAGSILSGPMWFALGAATMFYLDPDRGRRRRALVRDKLYSAYHQAGQDLRKTAEYSRDRAFGLAAETRAHFTSGEAGDRVISERVRAALGRAVSHPSAIAVDAHDGVVTLRGAVLAHEVDSLMHAVSHVRGVHDVIDQMEVHKHPGDVPELQGGVPRPGERYGVMEEYWDPLTRSLASIGGTGLTLWGLARGGIIGLTAAGIGTAFASRGMTNLPTKRLTGIGAGRRAVDVQKTITIHAPVERVFDFFANYQNFPHFMSNVREVRAGDSGRSHWVVAGPMGIDITWDADLTRYVPNEVIAWRSVPGATVENAGIMRFQPEGNGTRVDIKLSYNPPAGAIGHLMARLFGADPKSEMDADLSRVKTALETGHPPRDAAQPVESTATRGT